MKKDDFIPRDTVETAVMLFLVVLLLVAGFVVLDFDKIFPPTPHAVTTADSRQAVRLVMASGALDRRLEPVDNPLEPAPYAVSNFLDIDQASKRQASNRRP